MGINTGLTMGYGARFKSKEELAAAEPEGPPPLVIEEGSRQDTLGQFFDSIDCYIGNNDGIISKSEMESVGEMSQGLFDGEHLSLQQRIDVMFGDKDELTRDEFITRVYVKVKDIPSKVWFNDYVKHLNDLVDAAQEGSMC